MEHVTPDQVDWTKLGFDYIPTGKSFRAEFKDGQWQEGSIVNEATIQIHEASPLIHYGQGCFEGMKAYRTKENKIQVFRPELNAQRMVDSAHRLAMEAYPVEDFVRAIHQVVKANKDWVPPYGSGASLYMRPYLLGNGPMTTVAPAEEFVFGIYVTPVGPYFKGGLKPFNFLISDYDRAAPKGTGRAKAGGNYAAGFIASQAAKKQGYADAIYLDPLTHTKIEEVGAANFFGITPDGQFITPDSPSILPGITKRSLLWLAEHRLGLKAVEGEIYVDQLDQFAEAGAMGTAAVITPIGSITHGDHEYVFYSKDEVGPLTLKLYQELVGIQTGDIEPPAGWIQVVDC
ncbi:branched-chain amino acid aminotransferase [Hutsoniella sourekii]|uniref:branched-chain amino acid aminotransferase n=1 Tax=Hutsoniella sourekii TaxID=87650 RepID=UPI0004AE62E7|nr:branched-chain amino acid aminotransferase [Hutsoniella sourekii]